MVESAPGVNGGPSRRELTRSQAGVVSGIAFSRNAIGDDFKPSPVTLPSRLALNATVERAMGDSGT